MGMQTRDVALHFEKRPVALRRIQIAAGYGDGTEPVWQKAAVSPFFCNEMYSILQLVSKAGCHCCGLDAAAA